MTLIVLTAPTVEPVSVADAELFYRHDAAAGEIGIYADRLRVAGEACEAAYSSLTR